MATQKSFGEQLLEARRPNLKPGAGLAVVRANGDVDTIRFRAVTGIVWSTPEGHEAKLDDIVGAHSDVLSTYAQRLVLKVHRLSFVEWRDALQLAFSHAGGAGDPYVRRYDGWAPQDIAEDWIKRLAVGGRVEVYGGSHVVTGP